MAGVRPDLLRLIRSSARLDELRRGFENEGRTDYHRMVELCAQLGLTTTESELQHHLVALAKEREIAEQMIEEDEAKRRELDAMLTVHPRIGVGRGQPDLVANPMSVNAFSTESLMSVFRSISVVTRLREVQVLTGFVRVKPGSVSGVEGIRQMWGDQPIGLERHRDSNWLLGHEAFGEGVLFELDPETLGSWMMANKGRARLRNNETRVLVHSLSHLLMRALSPLSGYSQPSLRERLYIFDDRAPAVLVYTTVADIEGTMGGLAALGLPGKLESVLDEARQLAVWCSTDPVCLESHAGARVATTTRAGACHHCLLLPETSCELQNLDLDRAAIVGGVDGVTGFLMKAAK